MKLAAMSRNMVTIGVARMGVQMMSMAGVLRSTASALVSCGRCAVSINNCIRTPISRGLVSYALLNSACAIIDHARMTACVYVRAYAGVRVCV